MERDKRQHVATDNRCIVTHSHKPSTLHVVMSNIQKQPNVYKHGMWFDTQYLENIKCVIKFEKFLYETSVIKGKNKMMKSNGPYNSGTKP